MNETVKETNKAQDQAITAEKLNAEIAKLIAETSKINAETAKLAKESYWYPMVVATAFGGAIIALTKIFL